MPGRSFYLTTAIDYVNSQPHLGTAYEKIGADVLARCRRMHGDDVFFCMGTDEHSQNVEKEAVAQGLDPLVYCDRMAEQFEATWRRLGISHDRFIRTTEAAHRRAVEEMFRRIEANGDIFKAPYKGLYCVSCEAFYQEKDLPEGLCPNHRTRPQWLEEENYFFALSRYRDRLLEHLRENPGFIQPDVRRNEILRVLEGGLDDVSVSRASRRWGIPLPAEPRHVIYVWFDALINYITAAGFPDGQEAFGRRWPAQVHVIGKDITRFHCIIWPAMLLSAKLPLPEQVFGHGWVSFKGERMSKSLGNIVRPLEAVEAVGADPLRYFLMREIAWGRDGDFSWEAFVVRYNADLANDLGNLLSRTLTMVGRYLEGRVPGCGDPAAGEGGAVEADLRAVAQAAAGNYLAAMAAMEFQAALFATWELVRRANRYVEEKSPWSLAAAGSGAREELRAALYHLLESCRLIALQIAPVMPEKAEAMWRALGLTGRAAGGRFPADLAWRTRWQPGAASGTVVPGEPLFPRIQDEEALAAKAETATTRPVARPKKDTVNEPNPTEGTAPAATPAAAPAATVPQPITHAEFSRVQLRVAVVLAAERVPKTDKLLRLEVSLGGEEKRQIVAGIGASYEPEAMVGKRIVIVANLKPAVIRGVESQGMLLAAEGAGGSVVLAPEAPVEPGAGVK